MIRTFTLTALLCFAMQGMAQTTLVLQPGPADGKDAEIFSCVKCGYADNNYGTKRDFNAIAWTNNGYSSNVRSLIQFDLSSIPANAVINSATLSLYFNPTSEEGKHVRLPGSNASYLERITSSWSESTVTWNNQPTTTTLNRVSLAGTTSSTQSFTSINVKQLIIDSRNNPNSSFGFMLKLQQETIYKKLIFASSDNATASIRPKLTITYTVPARLQPDELNQTGISIFPNPAFGSATIQLPVDAGNGIVTINTYNMFGKLCAQAQAFADETDNLIGFDIASLQPGVYLVNIQCNQKNYSQRLVVR
jgi:hypothetical protein